MLNLWVVLTSAGDHDAFVGVYSTEQDANFVVDSLKRQWGCSMYSFDVYQTTLGDTNDG